MMNDFLPVIKRISDNSKGFNHTVIFFTAIFIFFIFQPLFVIRLESIEPSVQKVYSI